MDLHNLNYATTNTLTTSIQHYNYIHDSIARTLLERPHCSYEMKSFLLAKTDFEHFGINSKKFSYSDQRPRKLRITSLRLDTKVEILNVP